MKPLLMLLTLIPVLVNAQEFEFQFEPDSIPVTINNWQPFCPWVGGFSESHPGFCDIDEDGDSDLFIGHYFNTPIPFFRNTGSAITPDFSWETGFNDSLKAMENASRTNPDFWDLDHDGDFDALIGSGFVTYVENIGTESQPQFLSPRIQLFDTQGNWVFGTHVALTDIDADEDADLICGEYQGHLQFYRNIGTPDSFAFYLESAAWLGISVGYSGYADPTFCDLDGDHDYDLIIGEVNGNLWYYRNDGDSANYNFTYVTNHYFNIDVGDYASPEFADIDGDGDYDLFVGREANVESLIGDNYFYENIGSATNPQFQLITTGYLALDLGYSQTKPRIVDIDGDQALDLMVGTANQLLYFENTGLPSAPSFLFMQEGFQSIYISGLKPCFGDIDNDADLDLLCGQSAIPGPPTLALYLNRGTVQNPQFQLYSSTFLTNLNFFVNIFPGLADINADGDLDLFITDDHGYFYYYQNIGSPSWPNFILVTNQWLSYTYPAWRPFCFGDLDEDGDSDLLMESLDQWNLCYYENQGTPQVANMVLITQEFLPGYEILASNPFFVDIDNDSDLDLFVGEGNGGIMFFRNVTGQSPVDPRKRPAPTYPTIELTLQPNPGNPVAIVLSLPAPQPATLAVYNLLGAKVATLTSGFQPAGEQRYFWETTPSASGVYLVRLEAGGESLARKVVVLK